MISDYRVKLLPRTAVNLYKWTLKKLFLLNSKTFVSKSFDNAIASKRFEFVSGQQQYFGVKVCLH
jgi:hypothetical protein